MRWNWIGAGCGVLVILLAVTGCGQKQRVSWPGKLSALVVTGQSSRYHNWQVQHKAFTDILRKSGRFDVDIVVSPARGEDMSVFMPQFEGYDVVVVDYEGESWPEEIKGEFEYYVRNGGGVVIVHATDNAFPGWEEWNEIIGLGGWGGRDERWGPMVRWRDGGMVLDHSPGKAGTHPPSHDFQVVTRAPEHPVMRGLPAKWMQAHDELYSAMRGPAKNLQVLATACADKEKKRGTGENEPVLFTVKYGNGRVFHTMLGHVGPDQKAPVRCLDSVGFIVTLQRGAEWAATGEVTQEVPEDFPTAERTSLRFGYSGMDR